MRFKTILPSLLILFSFACSSQELPKLQIIPLPESVVLDAGNFHLDAGTPIVVSDDRRAEDCARLLNDVIAGISNYTLPLKKEEERRVRRGIYFRLDSLGKERNEEGYRLQISPDSIVLAAQTPAGLFYGIQTLAQLLTDSQFYSPEKRKWNLPALRIVDRPAFEYRGMHLDVSRHFFPKEFVMKYIDLMSAYKLNRFHWHLTDGAGWRIEIKKYPELTRMAAWRMEKDYLTWWKGKRQYATQDSVQAYGGYYTQEEIREVVAYAASKYVTVIPEIEMPGHSEEVLAVFPRLGCTGKPYRNGELCIGNEETFGFVEDVLTEVLELFPSEYIHIGGDEASKSAWKRCPKCQKRIQQEHLKDEKGLQSYMIHRVERFLNSHGRQLIGWDEILEGGLAPGAVVMSWRGEKGGIEAAKAGHPVIMTPGAYCYFDSYQAEPQTQPYAIGGFTPYLKTYSYYPVPESLTPDEAKYILGAQANLWTEYIPTPSHAEYMVFPRLLALSEVVWTPRERKDTEDFKYRVEKHLALLAQKGVNVFRLSDRVDILTEVDTAGRRIKVWFDSEKYRPVIRYTLNGMEPDGQSPIYREPFYVTDSTWVKAAVFHGEQRGESVSFARLDYHKAIGKKVDYRYRYNNGYPAAGTATLTDGYRGGLTYSDGRWQGFLTNLEVTVDLEKVTELSYVSLKFMQLTGPGVYMPDYVKVSVSDDGKVFREVGLVENDVPVDVSTLVLKDFTVRFSDRGRYVKVFAKKHAGFQFVDEIVVY